MIKNFKSGVLRINCWNFFDEQLCFIVLSLQWFLMILNDFKWFHVEVGAQLEEIYIN